MSLSVPLSFFTGCSSSNNNKGWLICWKSVYRVRFSSLLISASFHWRGYMPIATDHAKNKAQVYASSLHPHQSLACLCMLLSLLLWMGINAISNTQTEQWGRDGAPSHCLKGQVLFTKSRKCILFLTMEGRICRVQFSQFLILLILNSTLYILQLFVIFSPFKKTLMKIHQHFSAIFS